MTIAATTPPTILSRMPAAGISGVDPRTAITVHFSELMNASTINPTTFRVRAAGASSDVPATVSFSGSVAVLTPTAPLLTGVSYTATMAGTVRDAAGNAL